MYHWPNNHIWFNMAMKQPPENMFCCADFTVFGDKYVVKISDNNLKPQLFDGVAETLHFVKMDW